MRAVISLLVVFEVSLLGWSSGRRPAASRMPSGSLPWRPGSAAYGTEPQTAGRSRFPPPAIDSFVLLGQSRVLGDRPVGSRRSVFARSPRHPAGVAGLGIAERVADRVLYQSDCLVYRCTEFVHHLVDLLGEPVLALEAVLEPGQSPCRILGLDPFHGRRDGTALDLPDPIVGLVDRMLPEHGLHPGAIRLVFPGRGGGHHPLTVRGISAARSVRFASLLRIGCVSVVVRPATVLVRLVDPHRCRPMSRPNLGHSPKTTTRPATRFTPSRTTRRRGGDESPATVRDNRQEQRSHRRGRGTAASRNRPRRGPRRSRMGHPVDRSVTENVSIQL